MECPHPLNRTNDDISSLKHTGHGSRSMFALGCVVIIIIDCLGVALSILIKSLSILSREPTVFSNAYASDAPSLIQKSLRTNEKIPSEGIFLGINYRLV
jgi:hypothetical protein